MTTTLIQLARTMALALGLAAVAAAMPPLAWAGIVRASKPLDILILGGTGFTGPFQVNYALARGHKVTLFDGVETIPVNHMIRRWTVFGQ